MLIILALDVNTEAGRAVFIFYICCSSFGGNTLMLLIQDLGPWIFKRIAVFFGVIGFLAYCVIRDCSKKLKSRGRDDLEMQSFRYD